MGRCGLERGTLLELLLAVLFTNLSQRPGNKHEAGFATNFLFSFCEDCLLTIAFPFELILVRNIFNFDIAI